MMIHSCFSRILRTVAAIFIAVILAAGCAVAEEFWTWGGFEEEEDPNEIPTYWMKELERGAAEINQALLKAGRNKSAFLFYTDSHWNYSHQQSPVLLKYLYQHTGMTRTIFGGDIVWDEGTDYDSMAYLWDWRSAVKDLPNHHSVVGNHDDGNTINGRFDEDYVFAYLLAPEETPDVVYGDHGLYYYLDSAAEKTRYIFLDTAFQPILYYPDQLQFLLDTLTATPDNWHIVVIAHMWYNPDYDREDEAIYTLTYEADLVLNVLDAYNSRSNGIARCYASPTDSTVVRLPYDFSAGKGQVEFCIGGHTHRDYDNVSAKGIPVILVETDSYNVRSGLSSAVGTIYENSVNGIIADYDAGIVTIVRVGRGEGRIVPLK